MTYESVSLEYSSGDALLGSQVINYSYYNNINTIENTVFTFYIFNIFLDLIY